MNMLSFKNEQSSIYVDLTKTNGKYNVYVYDFILLRDVFMRQGMSKKEALKVFNEKKESYNCFIEV